MIDKVNNIPLPLIPDTNAADLLALFERMGRESAERRMRLQVDHSAALFGAGRGSLHFENIHAIRVVLEALLKVSGLARLARRNCADYRLEQVETILPHLPHAFDGYRIVQLSDLHADALIDGGTGILALLKGLDYDLAVITGDYRFETNDDYLPCLIAMKPIVEQLAGASDGCYGILGNHDFLELVPSLERMGVRMLLNERVSIVRGNDALTLAGVDDPHFYGAHDLDRALAAETADVCTILLAHSPEIIVKAEQCGVDLYLCGHTHGGQICLPGGFPVIANASCGYRYLSGTWKYREMCGYTSRGTGFSTAAVRFFCPPEITLHTLKRQGER